MKGVLFACLFALASSQDFVKELDSCIPASKESGYVRRKFSQGLTKASPVKKIYFINRDQDHPRFSHMKSQCKKAKGTPCEKFKATEATNIPKMDLKEVSNGNLASWLASRKGDGKNVFAAIFHSNYKLLEKILSEAGPDSEDLYMVLEDDSILAPDWKKTLQEALAHTPDDWQLLKVGYWGEQRCQDKVNNFVSALQYPSVDKPALGEKHFYSGNTAYVVKAKNIPKILSVLKEHSIGAIENAWMYPSAEGNQIISYTVSKPYKLVTVSHDFGRSKKNFLQQKAMVSSVQQKASGTSKEGQQTQATKDQSKKESAGSHPRAYDNLAECVDGASQRNETTWKPEHSKSLTHEFDLRKIVYLNVERNDDRDAHMQDMFANITTMLVAEGQDARYALPPVERFQAVTRDDITHNKVNLKEYSTGEENEYMKGYVEVTRDVTKAIWATHTKALQKIDQDSRKKKLKSKDDDLYLILEDDSFMDYQYKMRLQQMIHNTPDDFDMLKLGYWGNRHCIDQVNKFVYQANGPTFSQDQLFYQGNSGYVVKRGSIRKILENLKKKDIMDIDGAFLSSPQDCQENCIKVYAAAGNKMLVTDVNLGTMRVPTKKNHLGDKHFGTRKLFDYAYDSV